MSPTATASPIVEDCAQAFGATYQGQGVGGIGTTGVYSFNEYKTITCGDGGMIVTDDEDLYGRMFAIHDQGHAPNRLGSKYADRPFLGLNFRMTELSGAVLLAQVRKLDLIRTHLRANKRIVKSAIEDLPGTRLPGHRRPGGRPGHAPRRHLPDPRHRPRPSPRSSARSRSTPPAGMSTRIWSTSSSAGR